MSTREEIHLRRVELRCFRRSDGLYDMEASLSDCRPFESVRFGTGEVLQPDQPIHDLGVRLTFDERMVVHDIQSFTLSAPYPACPDGGRALQTLIGLRMTSGWIREVRERLSGARSCTHLMELMPAIATAAFQSVGGLRADLTGSVDDSGRPSRIDSCYAYAADGDLVRQRWPSFHIAASRQSE